MAGASRILIVVTGAREYRKVGYRTGLWLSELTHFWDVGEKAGAGMEIVSPSGGFVPIDPGSLMLQEAGNALGIDGAVHRRYEDRAFMDRLADVKKVDDVDAEGYDAIYLTGGHGVCFDFPESEPLARLIARFWESGKIVSAVCHGPAGLLEAKLGDGSYLVDGKKLTGFSWKEERLAKRDEAVPFCLEDELKRRGAQYSKSSVPFKSFVIEDGNLITGQNPASASGVGEAVVGRLKRAG